MTSIYDIALGQYYELGEAIKLNLEKFSPFELSVGEVSLPVKLPFTKRNVKLTGFSDRLNSLTFPPIKRSVLLTHLSYQRNGELTVNRVKEGNYIEATIVFANSVFYRNAHATSMEQLFNVEREDYIDAADWTEYFAKVMTGYAQDDFLVFEVLCKDTLSNEPYAKLNKLEHVPLNQNTVVLGRLNNILQDVVEIEYDGEPIEVTLLPGHNITPFLKVSYALTRIFSEFGYTLNFGGLDNNIHFQNLAVLNNTADTIVAGRLNYSMLVPTCTVAEFLKSISVILGCGFSFSGTQATLVFYNNKFNPNNGDTFADFTPYLSANPVIEYRNNQSLTLSSKALKEELIYRIPLQQQIYTLDYSDLSSDDLFTENEYLQFISDDGIRYISRRQSLVEARINYTLKNNFTWPNNYATTGVRLSIEDARDSAKYNLFENFFSEQNITHYKKITIPFVTSIADSLTVGNHSDTHQVTSPHQALPDIAQYLISNILDNEIFPKTYIGEVRRLNSRLSFEIEQGGTPRECPIMFAFSRRGTVKLPAVDPGTYFYAVHFYGSSTHTDIIETPDEVGEYTEMSLNFGGWKGVYNNFYQQFYRILSNSPVEVSASLNLPVQELNYIDAGNPILIHGTPLSPTSIKFILQNGRAKVVQALFRTLVDYINEAELDDQNINQQILNQE